MAVGHISDILVNQFCATTASVPYFKTNLLFDRHSFILRTGKSHSFSFSPHVTESESMVVLSTDWTVGISMSSEEYTSALKPYSTLSPRHIPTILHGSVNHFSDPELLRREYSP
jgi:hypothetical protein